MTVLRKKVRERERESANMLKHPQLCHNDNTDCQKVTDAQTEAR